MTYCGVSRSKMVSFAGVVVLAFGVGCVDADIDIGTTENAIIDGTLVDKEELPTIGGIMTNAGSVCTGTLITPTVVLTAAHCVEPTLIKQSIEAAGGTPPETIDYFFSFDRQIDPADPTGALTVESVVWHPEFLNDFGGILERPGRWHDIALMFLDEEVTDRPLQRIASPEIVEALELERSHLVAGFGLTDDGDPMSAGTLTKGLSHLNDKGENELIAGVGDEQQACRGDSGGPIFADDGDSFQIGVASRINADLLPPPSEPPPCETGLLYTRVDTYREWIGEHVPELGGDDSEPGDPDADPESDPEDEPAGDGANGDGGCRAASGTGATSWLLLLGVAVSMRRRRRHGAR